MRRVTLSQLSIVGKFLSLRPQRPSEYLLQSSRSARSRFLDLTDSSGPVPTARFPPVSYSERAHVVGRRFAIDFRCRRVSCLTTRFYHFLVKGLSSVERFLDFCVRGLWSLGHVGGYWAGRRLRLIVFGTRSKDPLQYFGTGRKSSPIVLRSVCCAIVACFCLFLLGIASSCVLYFDGQLDDVTVRSGCDGKHGTKTRR